MARIDAILLTAARAMSLAGPLAAAVILPAAPAWAQAPAPAGSAASLTTERAGLLYDQCLAIAGAKASRAGAADADLYPHAKAECATLRGQLLAGFETGSERADVFNMIDDNRAKTLPQSTRQQRELRR